MPAEEWELDDLPGAEQPWLRRILLAPAMPERPPLTLEAVREVRHRISIHAEHGLATAAQARAWNRDLDQLERELEEA